MARSMLLASATGSIRLLVEGVGEPPACDSFTGTDTPGAADSILNCPAYCVLSGASRTAEHGRTAEASCADYSYLTKQRAYGNLKMTIPDEDGCAYYASTVGQTFEGPLNSAVHPIGCYETATGEVHFNTAVQTIDEYSYRESDGDVFYTVVKQIECNTLHDCIFDVQEDEARDNGQAVPPNSKTGFNEHKFVQNCIDVGLNLEYDCNNGGNAQLGNVPNFAYCYDNVCESACGTYDPDDCPDTRCEAVGPLGEATCAEVCGVHTTKFACSETAAISAINDASWGLKCVWDAKADVCQDSCAFTYESAGNCPSSYCETTLVGELNSELQICQEKCEIYGSPPSTEQFGFNARFNSGNPAQVIFNYDDFSNCPSQGRTQYEVDRLNGPTQAPAAVDQWLWTQLNTDLTRWNLPDGRCQWFKGSCQDTCQLFTVENCPERSCDASDGACKLPCAALTLGCYTDERCEVIAPEGYVGDTSVEGSMYLPESWIDPITGDDTAKFEDRLPYLKSDGSLIIPIYDIMMQTPTCEDKRPNPTPAPTCAEDNANWYYGDIKKTCANFVAKDPRNRCRMKGRLIDSWQFGEGGTTVAYPQNNEYSIRMKASEACPTTCGGCGCSDNAHWQVREGKTGKSCKWVAKKPQTRCDRMGRDADDNKALASEGCCYSCRAEENQFRPFTSQTGFGFDVLP